MAPEGEKTCLDGKKITDPAECATACPEVGARLGANLKNGRVCYKTGAGKCRQNGAQGRTASLVCKNDGRPL